MDGEVAAQPAQIRKSIRNNHLAQLTAQGVAPKARTAYAIYTAEISAKARSFDDSKRKDLFKDAAAKWHAMPAEEKQTYNEQSQE
jgi:hypothetical protein